MEKGHSDVSSPAASPGLPGAHWKWRLKFEHLSLRAGSGQGTSAQGPLELEPRISHSASAHTEL